MTAPVLNPSLFPCLACSLPKAKDQGSMFCLSGTNRRAPESPTWGNSLSLCCAPRKGGAAASRQSMVTARAPAPGHPSGIVEGTNLWLGSSDNQFSWPPALSLAPGEWGRGFLAAFSYSQTLVDVMGFTPDGSAPSLKCSSRRLHP